jgi:hypothetical protein
MRSSEECYAGTLQVGSSPISGTTCTASCGPRADSSGLDEQLSKVPSSQQYEGHKGLPLCLKKIHSSRDAVAGCGNFSAHVCSASRYAI